MTPTCEKWVSKLASAFHKPFRKEYAQTTVTEVDQSVYGRPPFIDTRPPTTGSVQLGVPLLQADCLLFNLPIEIQQTFYKYVFGPSLIHVESLGHRLIHMRCEYWDLDGSWDGHAHCEKHRTGGLGTVCVDNSEDPNDQLISLCLTCRRM